jgi:hypothetical protein
MHLTREKAIAYFRHHWRCLADTGSADKEAFPRYHSHEIDDNCYLCHYAGQHRRGYRLKCDSCPILWPQIRPGAEPSGNRCMESFYYYWINCNSEFGRKRLARVISELPEKEGKR